VSTSWVNSLVCFTSVSPPFFLTLITAIRKWQTDVIPRNSSCTWKLINLKFGTLPVNLLLFLWCCLVSLKNRLRPLKATFVGLTWEFFLAAPVHTCGCCCFFLIRMGRRDLRNTSDRSCVMVKIMVISDQTSVLQKSESFAHETCFRKSVILHKPSAITPTAWSSHVEKRTPFSRII